MYSAYFLSAYSIFKAGVEAYRDVKPGPGNVMNQRAIATAFEKVSEGLSDVERQEVLSFLRLIAETPNSHALYRSERATEENELDMEVIKSGNKLIAEGLILVEEEFLRQAGLSQGALAEKRREYRIFRMPFSLQGAGGRDYYPAFFADKKYDIEQLEKVCKVLGRAEGVRKYRFFTTPSFWVNSRTPLQLLAAGQLNAALFAAQTFMKKQRETR
jgi:hypothetical protein